MSKVSTLFLCISSTFIILSDVCRKSVRVLISICMIYFNNFICITLSLDILLMRFSHIPQDRILGNFMSQLFKYNKDFLPENCTHFQHGNSMLVFLSIVPPRYVTTSTHLMFIASVSTLRRFFSNGLFGVWKKIKLVFWILIIKLFSMQQRHSFWIVQDTVSTNVLRSFSYNISAVSAKSRVITFLKALYKSFIYNTKNSGPKTEP